LRAGAHIAALALALLVLAPAAAQAGTASVENGRLKFAAAAGEANNVTISGPADGSAPYEVTDLGAPVTPGPGCQAGQGGAVLCGPSGISIVEAQLGDKDDVAQFAVQIQAVGQGGAGNDTLRAGAGDDVLRGEDGNDTIEGGGGNDSLQGAAGDDQLSGGLGDDNLQGGVGVDFADGDAGNDTLVTGEGDDTLVGDDGNDRLEAGTGEDYLDGGAGNDVLLTAEGEFKGDREKRIRCGAGDDSLTAGPADSFVSDCERTDGASLRLSKGGTIPLRLVCPVACRGTVSVRDKGGKIKASAKVRIAAATIVFVPLRLDAGEVALLFQRKKARMTAVFDLRAAGKPQKSRATFTLLRRV
jgi:Ca2+-binding RTX toxin-like protein